ncbi:MAG: 30S ribosome-binding factor RbfA [Phycisphaerales bacterium]|nr:30S ribosome-binding factor RbfA [Phycisphaerales bacterium]
MSSYRILKLASTVRSVVSDAIRNELNDPRISPMTSVTRVELSGDLQVAKVFVTVFGSGAERRRTFAGLQHATGYIQRYLAGRLDLRHCPSLRLELDESIQKTNEMLSLIEETMREHQSRDAADDGESAVAEQGGSE